jgi:uncharacterized protein (DUF58 family)
MNKVIVAIVFLALIALFTGSPSSYQALYISLGLLLLVWWGLRSNLKKIKVSKDLSGSSGFAGTELSLDLQLANPSRFPIFWCTVTEPFPEQLGAEIIQALVSLPSRSRKKVTMKFHPRRRGIYSIPETKLTIGDPFGLKEINIIISYHEKITIYPRLFPVVGLNLNRHLPLGQKKITFGLHEDPSRLRGCRDYSPGDSVKKVHWPSLARTGVLKVKEWESTLAAEIGIFLNLGEEDFPVSDWFWLTELGIDFTASLMHLLIENKETVGFYCNGKNADTVKDSVFMAAPKRGYQQEKRVLHFLAGADVKKGLGYISMFHEAYHLMGGSCLIFITPQVTQEMMKRAGALSKAGFHPVFLWLKSRSGFVPFIDLKQTAIPCFAVEKRWDSNVFFVSRPG